MSTLVDRSNVGQRETSDFAWMVPAISLLFLLIVTIGVISGFPAPTVVGPDGFLVVP
jgi:hypothetical protein